MERRLAAILAADVAAYGRLMGRDEAGTLADLKKHHKELIEPKIAEHRGRIVKLMGDGLLAEFPSAVEAVQCAIELQHIMARRNDGVPEDRRIVFRIGINVGDIVVEDGDIHGDGVNIAARLEGLAEPGGICLSSAVHTQVRGKLTLTFDDLGEKELKNIAEPVGVQRVVFDDLSAVLVKPVVPIPAPGRRSRWPVIAAGLALCLLAAGILATWRPWAPDVIPASPERMALPLPDKPSIAVLPFNNISDDPEQEYFADGMTEDLITDLSKISGLFVIARNSTFVYKGKAVEVRQVAEDLGVRYVMEGSVRRAGNKIRINAQLIDARTGSHLWADRYDRDYKDVFKLQDEVIRDIVSALQVELTDSEKAERERREQTANLQAHEYFLRGNQHLGRFTARDAAKAKEYFEKAIELDPDHVRALTALGRLHYNEWQIWGVDRDRNLARAVGLGKKALAVDDKLAGPHLLLSQAYRYLRQHEQSKAELNKALALEAGDAETLVGLGDALRYSGRPREAIEVINTAMRLDPFYPAWWEYYLGHALFQTGRYEEAIVALQRGAERNTNYPAFPLFMAASYAMLDRPEEAKSAAAEVLRINPRFTLKAFAAHVQYNDKKDLERDLAAFRKAGLPE